MTTPVTGTLDIDWLRSVTTIRTTRRARRDDEIDVLHLAIFGIRPGAVPDVPPPHSRTGEHFRPELLTGNWVDGELSEVHLSGSLRRKNGGVSAKVHRDRIYRGGFSDGARTAPAGLPAEVEAALQAYETAVALASGGPR